VCHVDADSILFVCILKDIINNIHFQKSKIDPAVDQPRSGNRAAAGRLSKRTVETKG
jgi:hypothetical protein